MARKTPAPAEEIAPLTAVNLSLAVQGKRDAPSREHLAYIYDRYWELKRNVDMLMQRTDGWLRIVPKLDDDRIYLKFKFTGGRWAHHYIMSVVDITRFPEGLMLLVHKLHQVELGDLRPSKDKPYDDE